MTSDTDNNNESIIRDDLYQAALNPTTLEGRVILLTERVRVLTNESINNKQKIAKLEVAYQRGFGIFLVFPLLGGFVGFLATYWSLIFKPWTGK